LKAGDASFDAAEYPEPEARAFEFSEGKKLLVYSGSIQLRARSAVAPSGAVVAKLRYQACDETHCLAPTSIEAALRLDDGAASPGGRHAAAIETEPPSEPGSPSWLTSWLEGASLPAALGMMLVLGLTLNLTPCVYPLISVTLGYFGSQSEAGSKPLALAIAYVLGITTSFAVLGVSAAWFGGLIGAPLQHPAVLLFLASLFIVLAASSFGLFHIRAPAVLMQRFGGASAGLGGALLMGLTMGIVAAPCIGPVVLGLLVYVGAHRDAVVGFVLFFVLGLGMGVPYILLASAAGSLRRLPRSGEWLAWVNRLFGVVLLGMALYFASPLLPTAALRAAVPIYLAAAGLYLGFLDRTARALRWFTLGRRAFGAAVLGLAVWAALPDAQARDEIRWEPLSVTALDRAITDRRPAIVEFSAEWCMPCREMARTTFIDHAVVDEANRFSMLRADVTEDSDKNDALLAKFQVAGVPTMIFYDGRGSEVDRVVGYIDGASFAKRMRRVVGPSEPPSRPSGMDLTRLGHEGGDVVAGEGAILAADHVGAQRVDAEPR
jgi:thiol:disulfide interchange protein DsbD